MALIPTISIRDVSKRYRLYRERPQSFKEAVIHRLSARYEELWALQGVSLEIEPGCTFGLIGPNGSGKSTLLKLIAGVHQPTSGSIEARGRIGALLELGAGFHPDLTGRENVYLNGSIMGLSRREIRRNIDHIIAFSGLEQFIDSPVKIYSSGMYVRLGFSVAVNLEPDILIVDEVLTVGDEEFQRRCMEHIFRLRNSGVTIVFVSHSLTTVQSICDQVAWLDRGQLAALGKTPEVIERYLKQVNDAELQEISNSQPAPPMREEERWGSGEIRITGLELLDEKGQATDVAVTGHPLTIRLHFIASESVANCVFGVAFYSLDGTHLAESNTRFAAVKTGDIEGSGCVDYILDRVPLIAGRYLLGPSIHDSNLMHCYDFRYKAFPLQVRPGTGSEIWGFVELGGSWGLPQRTRDQRSKADRGARTA
jgi:ABC-type polysaccharide/polyol phosphate transport system ATPase subunit